jgi:DNA-binding response OmpR family regulator
MERLQIRSNVSMLDVPPTLAIVDGDPVTGRALRVLLEGAGYKVHYMAQPIDGHLRELLEDAELLLLPHTLGPKARDAWVDSIAEIPELASLPIVALTSYGDEPTHGGAHGLAGHVPWPSSIGVLMEHIEAVLSDG